MRTRRWMVAALCLATGSLVAGQESGLDRGRRLFRENRWDEAREAVRSELERLEPAERDQARLLLGLSLVKEAELYGALDVFATEVGLEYLAELRESKENRESKWLPLFTGIYQLSAGENADAERSLKAALSKPIPEPWLDQARMRLAVARATGGASGRVEPLAAGPSPEARYYEALLEGSRPDEDVLEELIGTDLDAADVEDRTDPEKLLRFFDPIRLQALERIAWERAIAELLPLAEDGNGMAAKLARFHAGASLFHLEDRDKAAALLGSMESQTLGPTFYSRARLLTAAMSWGKSSPSAAALEELWQATSAYPEAVLLWKDVERPELRGLEPFASKLAGRFESLPASWGERADETLVGRWGLAALRSGAESSEVLHTLSGYRNHANKNKIEFNDPLLLVALCAANYENNDYAQALETLFELSKTFPGLRGLQWNLQGVYAARQKAGGDARIAN